MCCTGLLLYCPCIGLMAPLAASLTRQDGPAQLSSDKPRHRIARSIYQRAKDGAHNQDDKKGAIGALISSGGKTGVTGLEGFVPKVRYNGPSMARYGARYAWSFPCNLPILLLPGFSSRPTAMDVHSELSSARCRRKKGSSGR